MWHCDVLPGLLWAPGSTWWCCQVAWSTVPPGLLQCSSSNLVVAPNETWPFDAMLTWKMPWKMLINLEWGTRHILWAWRWTSSYLMGIQPPTGHSSASPWVFMFPLGISHRCFFLPGSWDDVIGNTRKTRGSQGFESWSFAHLRNGYLKICVVCQSWVSEFPKLKTQFWDSPIYSPFLGKTLKSSQSVFFEWPRRLAMMAGPKERAGLMEQPVTSDPPVIVRMVYSVYHINDPPMGSPTSSPAATTSSPTQVPCNSHAAIIIRTSLTHNFSQSSLP